MADKYSSDLTLVVIAQIAQTIGYSSTLSAPLELLQDVMQKFTQEFARDLHGHMEHANRIRPNIKDARLSMKSLNINVQELLDYIGNVEPVGFTRDVPEYPIRKAVNMNFLKPGSAETLTRPVYIFEYLPPMQDPETREIQADAQKGFSQKREFGLNSEFDVTSSMTKPGNNHINSLSPNAMKNFPSNAFDSDVGRSVREMSSVVMTTGGFISPAIEGKLPEAFIPDIIEKYKGLDAPSPASIVVHPLEYSPKLVKSETEGAISSKKLIPYQHSETKNCNQNIALLTSESTEASLLLHSKNIPMSAALSSTTSKKSKKQKQDLTGELGRKDKFNNVCKTEEKSQRKALKLYQKLSKNQCDNSNGEMLHLKKSKKRVNRGNSSSDLSNIHLEKMLKKQAKHVQKSLQIENDAKSFGYLQTSQTMSAFPSDTILNTENPLSVNIPSEESGVIKQIASNSQNSIFSVQHGATQPSPISESDKKNTCEPERNKLDIFKKISKPRTIRQDGGAISGPPGMGVRVFGNSISGSPLISLPSGTTITPTPPLGLNTENINVPSVKINHFGILNQTPHSPKADVKMSIIDSVKPKKRGRKPGGKNLLKQTNFTSHSLVESAKREKSTNEILLPPSSSVMVVSQNILNVPIPTEPLNLCNSEQVSSESLQNFHAQDKKERKKNKSKYDTSIPENIKEFTNNVYSTEKKTATITSSIYAPKKKNIVPCPDPFMAVSSTLSNTSMYSGNQPGMVPLLPLLHFPPRPGLIPSGPGLFPAVTGLVGFGNNSNRVGITPFIAFSGQDGSVPDAVRCPPNKDSADTDSNQFLRRSSTQTDLQMDRNYCNVAPLVPDSMKLADCKALTCGNDLVPPKFMKKPLVQASGNLGDPIEVSDDSDESIQNRQLAQRKSPLSSPILPRSSLIQPLSFAPSTSICEDDSHLDIRNNLLSSSSESIKKLKKPVKMTLPDVKNIIHASPSSSSFPQFNLPNFMGGGDKFSLAGGADLIPLSRVDCGSAYSSHKVPSSSLTGAATSGINPILTNHMNISEEQKFLPTFANYEDITITPTGAMSIDLKGRKHHKKLKKIKDGKIKKKKDKKDKSKRKDRIGITSYKTDRKIKGLEKKQKKEKKKDKDKQILIHIPDEAEEFPRVPLIKHVELGSAQSVLVSAPVLKLSPMIIKPTVTVTRAMSPKLQPSPNQIPKLTLKLCGKSTPLPISENNTEASDTEIEKQTTTIPVDKIERERHNSPELARFSPLVTGPPKNKQSDTHLLSISSTAPSLNNSSNSSAPLPTPIATRPTQIPISHQQTSSNSAVMTNSAGPAPRRGSFSPATNIPEDSLKVAETSRPSSYVDAEGNRIWICPACGKVDDGSAMIGCDGCDAWYHWICVGITFAPKDNDDWFCRVCVTKKRVHGSDKKKKRNKKK
ncbi:transcription initiation factor TFIID subunit 3 isoform X2 [Drosophila rhopaloa]|uniref:PHD-type domain-containing protein n=1 Tax=Drosophila rhopaloa TaxID=1041015 RepID=A0ABM5JCE5_DRORH|nr:transcription initiation factor TFIID subunit 3 isoform X2 [Drosophila rhopaloa]